MNKYAKLEKQIAMIPGEDGWWNSSGEETFNEIALKLSDKGINDREIIDILSDCYYAVSEEFGS